MNIAKEELTKRCTSECKTRVLQLQDLGKDQIRQKRCLNRELVRDLNQRVGQVVLDPHIQLRLQRHHQTQVVFSDVLDEVCVAGQWQDVNTLVLGLDANRDRVLAEVLSCCQTGS